MGRVSQTVDILYENFDEIKTKDEFKQKVRLSWKKFGGKKIPLNRVKTICFGLWTRIYSIDLSNKKEVDTAEEYFSKLIKITSSDEFYISWNKTKFVFHHSINIGNAS